MPDLYILWDINVEGPGGTETLLFSNREYVLQSGPLAGESYRASWMSGSFEGWTLDEAGYAIANRSVLTTGGVTPRTIKSLEVANAVPGEGRDRELDFLFTSAYTVEGVVIGKMAVVPIGGPQPSLASFVVFFTGKLSDKTIKGKSTVTFFPKPTSGDLDSPLLTKLFNGMAGFLQSPSGFLMETATSPSIIGGDWTIGIYASLSPTAFQSRDTYIRIEDSGATSLIEVYADTSDNNVKLTVNRSGGTDTYTLFDLDSPPGGLRGGSSNTFFFIYISWEEAVNNVLNVWVDKDKVLDDETILNDILGTEDIVVLGDVGSTSTMFNSSVRIWSKLSTEAQVFESHGAIEHLEEVDLESAWEFDSRRGLTVIDYSGNARHITLNSSDGWDSEIDGDAPLDGTVQPLAVGSVFSAPVILHDFKLDKGFISVAVSDIIRTYSQGMALVDFMPANVGSFQFRKGPGVISLTTTGVFGERVVPNQRIRVEAGASGDFDDDYTVDSLVPINRRHQRPLGLDYRFEVFITDDSAWPSTTTETATVRSVPNDHNWLIIDFANPYSTSGNIEGKYVKYLAKSNTVSPLFCDILGDGNILSTSPPVSGFVSPAYLDNVISQLLGSVYGPKWNTSIFPLPVYQSLDFRVGYYIASDMSTKSVVDDLIRGCQVWLLEDGDGVQTLQEFQFPEDIVTAPEVIEQDSVVSVEQPFFPLSGIIEISELRVQYAKSWATMDKGSIPDAVDEDTRSFIVKEWRTTTVGTTGVANVLPTMTTYVSDKTKARDIGNRVLRLSQGRVDAITLRIDALTALTFATIGSNVTGALEKFGLPALDSVVLQRTLMPAKGLAIIHVWSE